MNFKKIKPSKGKVLIKRVPDEEVTSGGVIIPGEAQDKTHKGKVIATGSDVKNVKKGEVVLHLKYGGEQLGDDHAIIKAHEIIAIIADD